MHSLRNGEEVISLEKITPLLRRTDRTTLAPMPEIIMA